MKIFKKWIKIAEDDLESAKILFEKGINTTSVYHSQQCAEKALKGFLAYHQQPVVKTHDLNELINLCNKLNPDFNNILSKALSLNDYIIEFRYPGSDEDPDDQETENAINTAAFILEFTKEKITP